MYVPDGWGTVYAIDGLERQEGHFQVAPWIQDRQGLAVMSPAAGQQPRRRALEGQGHLHHPRRPLIAINKATGEVAWGARSPDPAIAETLTAAPLSCVT